MPSRPGRMRKFRIDESSYVDRAAQESGMAPFMKRATLPEDGEPLVDFVKRYPAAGLTVPQRIVEAMLVYEESAFGKFCDSIPVVTSTTDGHAHIVWLYGERGGETTMQISADDEVHHDHVWTIGPEGTLTVADARGHGHVVDPTSVLAAMQEMLIANLDAPDVVVDVVFAASAPDDVIDKRLTTIADTVAGLEDGTIVAKYNNGQAVAVRASLPDGTFPIRCSADLATAIGLVGEDGGQPQVAHHIVKRARVLGLVDELPLDGALSIAKAGPAGETTATGGNPVPEPKKGDEGLQKQLDALTAQNETLTKALDTATKVAALPDPQRGFYAKLVSDEDKTAFLSKSSDERDAQIDEITKGDPVVYTALDGTAIRKSAGDLTIRLAKQVDEQAKRLAKSESEKATTEFEKRAEGDLGNLPGDVGVRAAVLKAIDAIEDGDVRKSGLEMLTAANTAMGKVTKNMGTSHAPTAGEGSAEDQINVLAKAHSTEHDVDFYEAYDKVAAQHPELAKAAINGQ